MLDLPVHHFRAVTHDGQFHADDVLAAAILTLYRADRFGLDTIFTRTRDPDVIRNAHFVFDVGHRYSPAEHRYDHHQREFSLSRGNGIQYASAGLVWMSLGNLMCGPDVVEEVDRLLLAAVDATDNGQHLHGPPAFLDVRAMTVSGLIHGFNPMWDEVPNYDYAFEKAVRFAHELLVRTIARARSSLAATPHARGKLLTREHPKFVVLDRYIPWTEAAYEHDELLYVVFPATTSSTWNIQAVTKERGSPTCKRPFPESWWGLEGDALSHLIHADAVFCHRSGFIAGAKTREAALEMVELALMPRN